MPISGCNCVPKTNLAKILNKKDKRGLKARKSRTLSGVKGTVVDKDNPHSKIGRVTTRPTSDPTIAISNKARRWGTGDLFVRMRREFPN